MSVLAEAVIAALDANADLTWITARPGVAIARFEVSGARIDTTFTETGRGEWQVGFDEYLQRQDTYSRQLGYRMGLQIKSSPLTECTIKKTTPSQWKDDRP